MQTLTEPLPEVAEAALEADHWERDRVAWNLPRDPVDVLPLGESPDGLDWASFRDLYYPDSRRHDLQAIVAYGAYKRSPHAGSSANEATYPNGDPISTEVVSLDGWEDEGGA